MHLQRVYLFQTGLTNNLVIHNVCVFFNYHIATLAAFDPLELHHRGFQFIIEHVAYSYESRIRH